jgi:hypothetical protein
MMPCVIGVGMLQHSIGFRMLKPSIGQNAATFDWSKCCNIRLVKMLQHLIGQNAATFDWSKCCNIRLVKMLQHSNGFK